MSTENLSTFLIIAKSQLIDFSNLNFSNPSLQFCNFFIFINNTYAEELLISKYQYDLYKGNIHFGSSEQTKAPVRLPKGVDQLTLKKIIDAFKEHKKTTETILIIKMSAV